MFFVNTLMVGGGESGDLDLVAQSEQEESMWLEQGMALIQAEGEAWMRREKKGVTTSMGERRLEDSWGTPREPADGEKS
jgi:hypothetical protein